MRFFGAFLSFALLRVMTGGVVTISSGGLTTPETISAAPAGFGLAAGSLVIADAASGAGQIFSIPSGGGVPTALLSSAFSSGIIGGTFAPSSYGSLSNDYLAFVNTPGGGSIYALAPNGNTLTPVFTAAGGFEDPSVAPAGFGTVGGDVLFEALGSGHETIDVLTSAGTVTPFATNVLSSDFTTAALFAPAGFVPGSSGSVLLLSAATSGNIYWVDGSGALHLFTTVPFSQGQVGLAQMAFAPAGFGAYGGDLFVSAASQHGGGGLFGAVDVINGSGQLVGVLQQGTVNAPFDPRGLYFASTSQLYIADTDPSILSATPDTITPVPEPAAFALVSAGVAVLLAASRRRAQ